MRNTVIVLSLLLSCCFAFTQERKNQSLFLEVGGSGGLASINYEAPFLAKFKSNFQRNTWRLGFSVAPIDKNNGTGLVFPLMINSLVGRKAHLLELGLGQGITITTRGSFFSLTTAAVGYRYQPKKKPWFFRATYTPLISYILDFQVQQWGGVSLGYTFKSQKK